MSYYQRIQIYLSARIRSLIGYAFITCLFAFIVLSTTGEQAGASSVQDLRQRLMEQQKNVENIEEEIAQHEREIAEARRQATTLEQEVTIISQGTRNLTLQIDKTVAEMAAVETEINAIQEEQGTIVERITEQRDVLRELLRMLQLLDTDSIIEAFFKYPTLSQAITEVQAVYRTEQHAQEILGQLRSLQSDLTVREDTFSDLQRELEGLRGRQVGQKETLEQQQVAKERLIELTREQEAELEQLRQQSADRHRSTEAEIARLDKEIRTMLESQGKQALGAVGEMVWPVNPIFGISCGFHCAGYPYTNLIGPHSGIDIPVPMGTQMRAASDGYVARVRATPCTYTYILILHGDDTATLYGHITSSSVSEGEYVTRGQVIGGTGGQAYSPGMSCYPQGLSTGPHLHFEVRRGGIPVNPRLFLP